VFHEHEAPRRITDRSLDAGLSRSYSPRLLYAGAHTVMNSSNDLFLGVNIDHVATLRQARGGRYPDPIQAALEAEQAGADAITVHLREDRRHILDRDVELLSQVLQTRMNFEMAVTGEMLAIAERIRPADCCLVPENRAELTTEGGLDVAGEPDRIADACRRLSAHGIAISLFIDPEAKQLESAARCGAGKVEIHTGRYADAKGILESRQELARIQEAARIGLELGLQINAGHGLNYHNVAPVAAIPELTELNIGHAIVGRALFCGLGMAVRDMKQAMMRARNT